VLVELVVCGMMLTMEETEVAVLAVAVCGMMLKQVEMLKYIYGSIKKEMAIGTTTGIL
jgi:hypothetical protein